MFIKTTELSPTKLVGKSKRMSNQKNITGELWREFMPVRNSIPNRKNQSFLSMQVYDKNCVDKFAPETEFDKWAAVEVEHDCDVPENMHVYEMGGGTYALFEHIGPARSFPKTLRYIFSEWLPNSEYQFDDREMFEELEEGYDPNAQDAREIVWLPVKPK